MGIDKIFTKQCEKAEEIQRLFNPEELNFLYDHTIRHGTEYKYKEYRTFSPEFNLPGRLVFDTGDGYEWHCIWLPRQDQLQEMVTGNPPELLERFTDWYYKWDGYTIEGIHPELESIPSMEQLWLAFVMKEKYGKAWNGKDWIKEQT